MSIAKFMQLSAVTELKLHFQQGRYNCYTADILFRMYDDEHNRLYLLYLKSVLSEVQQTIKAFEGEKSDSTKLLNILVYIITSLCKKIVIPTAKINFMDVLKKMSVLSANETLKSNKNPSDIASLAEHLGFKTELIDKIVNQ
ncbi:hypothetical protein PR048_009728 [Dryococelus australis]|uniref:Uncharacterized protein n=1 Tax=Dryococelus australis TaxID=614101 RepID=A0ABQ9I0R3_9NEOP|nr:hypothetical protein PR048_009728 [Dryococelus australis]